MNNDLASLTQLRHLISAALSESRNDASLQRFLASKASSVHSMIELGEGDQIEQLECFVQSYIEQIPQLLEHFHTIALAAGVETELKAFTNIAIDYFLHPLEITSDHGGLLKIMDAAYLAQRLIEEVNDRFISNAGVSICPIDNTEANVVMHFLIGESFANELDLAVHYSVEMLIHNNSLFSKKSLRLYADAQQHNQAKQTKQSQPHDENIVRLALHY